MDAGGGSDVLAFGRGVLHDEARALDALADGLGAGFEEAVDLIVRCSGKLIVSGLGKSGHVGRKIAATFASTGTTADLPPPRRSHPRRPRHGCGRRCRDPHFAQRRDSRAGAGDRPFSGSENSDHRDHRQTRSRCLARRRPGGAVPSALARGRAGGRGADDFDDNDARARRCAGDDGDAPQGLLAHRFRPASSRRGARRAA